MITLLVSLFALSPLSASVVAPTVARLVQDPPEDKREDIKVLVEELDSHAGARGDKDTEAVAVIDKLVQLFGECGPKDRASIVKGLDKCFKEKRQEDANGVRQNQLYLAAATALGEMAPESVPVLTEWIGHKTHRKDQPLQRLLILRLGKTADPRGIKTLIKLLDDPDPPIQAAAAEAMGEYQGAELEARKEMFEELLRLIMSLKNGVDTDVTDPIARNRYDTVAAPIITSLQRLSGHKEHVPEEWLRWWNKNKKADWDNLGS
ncbi:MAG TPA: HEAT repeat domain-containing protein [Planctomycetota bacterium]|nr:HEAT repeat domain-containing protein [Planctomycetota bacterium]